MADKPIPEKDQETGRFLTGNSGGGRPKGSRNLLGEAFLDAMHEDFKLHGVEAIVRVRDEKPDQYLKVIASILPKDLNVNINQTDHMTDEQLVERIRSLDAAIRPFLVIEGTSGTGIDAGPTTAH